MIASRLKRGPHRHQPATPSLVKAGERTCILDVPSTPLRAIPIFVDGASILSFLLVKHTMAETLPLPRIKSSEKGCVRMAGIRFKLGNISASKRPETNSQVHHPLLTNCDQDPLSSQQRPSKGSTTTTNGAGSTLARILTAREHLVT
jgi:hypothetical protein